MSFLRGLIFLSFLSFSIAGCAQDKRSLSELIENELSASNELHSNEIPYGVLRENSGIVDVWSNSDSNMEELENLYFDFEIDSSLRVSAFLMLQCIRSDDYLGLYSRMLINLDDSFSEDQKLVLLTGGGAAWGARPYILYQRSKEFRQIVDRSARINDSELIKSYLRSISSDKSLSYLKSVGINYCP